MVTDDNDAVSAITPLHWQDPDLRAGCEMPQAALQPEATVTVRRQIRHVRDHAEAQYGFVRALIHGHIIHLDITRYPIAYRFDGGIITLHAGNTQWLYVAARHSLQVIAFAADWVMWTLAVALVLYLVWLNMHREYGSYGPGPVASSPAPASP
jgi:hypothetical protein